MDINQFPSPQSAICFWKKNLKNNFPYLLFLNCISPMKNPFLWITLGVCSLLLIPALFMDGMFLDGVFYAAISKNFAAGSGTFWNPHYTDTAFPSLHEQPPLMFFIQGVFFKILGTGIYTERIYCLIAALVNAALIVRCWKIVYTSSSKLNWLPVLLWFTMPVTFYIFINNLEECTMGIFVIAAMLHLLRALYQEKNETAHLLLAGGMLLLAGLTKGFQGMFLLAAPLGWWLCLRKTGFIKALEQTFLVMLLPLLFTIYAWYNPVIHASLEAYFKARIVATFNHVHDTSGSRFHILYELLLDSLPLLIMMAVTLFSVRNKMEPFAGWKRYRGLVLFFLLMLAAGVLPLMITLEQRGFYLAPALPFLTIACSLLIIPQAEMITKILSARKKMATVLSLFGIIVLAGSLISACWLAGKPKRDAEMLNDLKILAANTGNAKILLLGDPLKYEWALYAYFMRNYNISLACDPRIAHEWLIQEKSESVPAGYQIVPLQTIRYSLYHQQP